MKDDMLSLAFSVHANKGVYALLLGSGVSRSAGIPTGWEIVLDLVRKLARLNKIECEDDPASWYAKEYGEEPSYDRLLNELAKSPSERANLVKGYLEPSASVIEEGLKKPTEAHRAIARLVKNGYIRVVLTTNFDRLIETALQDEQIIPAVIGSADSAEGALPLTHSPCTVIKLHGDYLDTRIKNTPQELEEYDSRTNELLDRIFDEYGLIVCGWSAEYDTALRAAMERCKSRRFTTYWTMKEPLGVRAEALVAQRWAQTISIENADSFFRNLSEKVQSLEDMDRPHPLSAKVAVASMKRYLVDERHKILLHDLVFDEVERLLPKISDENEWNTFGELNSQELVRRTGRYRQLSDTLLHILVTGCYWGAPNQSYIWTKCIRRITNRKKKIPGTPSLCELQSYPDLLLVYAGGIASVASCRYYNLYSLFEPTIFIKNHGDYKSRNRIYVDTVLEKNVAEHFPDLQRHPAPGSEHMYKVLRPFLQGCIPADDEYTYSFDLFEMFLSLSIVDLRYDEYGKDSWGPIGRFGYRLFNNQDWKSKLSSLTEVAKTRGSEWEVLQAGFFQASSTRFQQVAETFHSFLSKATRFH